MWLTGPYVTCDMERAASQLARCRLRQATSDNFDWTRIARRTVSGRLSDRRIGTYNYPVTGPESALQGHYYKWPTYRHVQLPGDWTRVRPTGTLLHLHRGFRRVRRLCCQVVISNHRTCFCRRLELQRSTDNLYSRFFTLHYITLHSSYLEWPKVKNC